MVDAYDRSLRLTFMSAIAAFVVVNVLVIFVKLPHLKRKLQIGTDNADATTGPE